ncbi:MAG: hypothetical protein K5917_00670 [Clostridiales bacterium]|nr:hypothetical protein [Clostridiales bacterium]
MSIVSIFFEIIAFALIICGVANEEKLIETEEELIKIIKIKKRQMKNKREKREAMNNKKTMFQSDKEKIAA